MGRCKQGDHCGNPAWCKTTGECLKVQPAPQDAGHQAMWPQMIAALAAIDAALGLPEDGCNSTAQTMEKIRRLRAVEDKANSYIVDNARLAEEAECLRTALAAANNQTERFERGWYLRGDALVWYRDEARALAKNMAGGAHTAGVLASVTVLALDAGQRADWALGPNVELTGPRVGHRSNDGQD